MSLTANDVIGLGAGALVIAVGLFVLAARPHAAIDRLFFVLALTDGMSTILFGLGYAVDDVDLALYFRATYYYFFVVFVALLVAFAVVFPRPILRRGATPAALAAVTLLALATLAVYARRHDLFWSATLTDTGIRFSLEPLGTLVAFTFAAATAIVGIRMTLLHLRDPSPSHRRQAAFVLGGMTLAYAPFAMTVTVQALLTAPQRAFFESRPDRILTYWGLAFFCVVLVTSAILIYRDRRPDRAAERRFVLGCYAAVLATAAATAAFPSDEIAALIRSAALLAYPVLLGYAIVRYEVFDIDARLRRAATVTLAAVGLTFGFVVMESLAENFLQERVLMGISSGWLSGSAAALATAAAFIPISKVSRNAAAKIVPELSRDELYDRKIEIYRHSLSGALADGILREGESRTLAALRASLGISDTEHARLVAEVAA